MKRVPRIIILDERELTGYSFVLRSDRLTREWRRAIAYLVLARRPGRKNHAP